MTIIEDSSYAETVAKLKADPIIVAMADEIMEKVKKNMGMLEHLAHPDGSPTHSFMLNALGEYHARNGIIPTHIGGPANAILSLITERYSPHGN